MQACNSSVYILWLNGDEKGRALKFEQICVEFVGAMIDD